MDDIRDHLRRLYAAVDATLEEEVENLRVRHWATEKEMGLLLNFGGELSQPQIENIALQAVSVVAHLPDHLRRWAKENKKSVDDLNAILKASSALQILIDLSDRNKHGGDRRDGGSSRKSPRLKNVMRVACLSTGTSPNGSAGLTVTPNGPKSFGSGSTTVIITGDVVAPDGKRIGDLRKLLKDGLAALENILVGWGLVL